MLFSYHQIAQTSFNQPMDEAVDKPVKESLRSKFSDLHTDHSFASK